MNGGLTLKTRKAAPMLLKKSCRKCVSMTKLLQQKHGGRANGPAFQWKEATSTLKDERANATSTSRAWRRSAGWLHDIRKSRKEEVRMAVEWKLRWYAHPGPDQARATEAQRKAMQTFAGWRATVTRGMLQVDSIVTELVRIASL